MQIATEIWNGSSWTEVNRFNTARITLTGGSSTAALRCNGGRYLIHYKITESWDGTNWTEVADVNTARKEVYRNRISTRNK